MSGTGWRKEPPLAGVSPAFANSAAMNWMATSDPGASDMRPSSTSEARKVKSARKSRIWITSSPGAMRGSTSVAAGAGRVATAQIKGVSVRSLRTFISPATDRSSGWAFGAFLRHVEIGDRPLVRFRGQPHRLGEGGMRVDGLADVDRVGAHLDGQGRLGDEVAGVGADDPGADDAVGFLVEEELGHSLVPAERQRPTRGGPRERALAVLDPFRL